MNSVLVTIAPAMEAFTSMYCPARRAVSAITQLSQVSQRGVQQPARRVAGLGSDGFSVARLQCKGGRSLTLFGHYGAFAIADPYRARL
jgi:hypothetical protein